MVQGGVFTLQAIREVVGGDGLGTGKMDGRPAAVSKENGGGYRLTERRLMAGIGAAVDAVIPAYGGLRGKHSP